MKSSPQSPAARRRIAPIGPGRRFLIAVRTDYRREVLGGGEGGANTCKTSSHFAATLEFSVAAGSEIATGSGKTYSVPVIKEAPCSWQQDIAQAAIPPP